MDVKQLDAEGRWWRVGSYEVDLRAEAGSHPWQARACALAHRDGVDDEGQEVAFLAACLADGSVTDPTTEQVVAQWLFDRSQTLVSRAWDAIRRIEGGSHVRAA